jgi:hypothetical protein
MGKKWTEGQDVGALGESEFRTFALELGLIPQRVEQDVGIDFFCQPVEGVGPVRAVSGHVVGACVRATRGKSGRIGLSAEDARHLLKCTFPVLIVLVHIHKKRTSVFARLLDDELGVRLASAVLDGQKSVSLKPSDLKDASEIAKDLEDLGGAAERARIRMVSRLMKEVVPSARLQVRRSESGQLTIVEVSSLFDAFDVSSEAGLKQLHTAVFGAPSLLGERLSQLPLNQRFVSSLEFLSGRVVVGGGVEAARANVTVAGSAGSATAKFRARVAPRKIGYVHDCGLSVTISERTLHEGRWVHVFESDIDRNVDVELEDHGEFWTFLEKCVPGSKVTVDHVGPYEIERFPALLGAGYFGRYLRVISGAGVFPKRTLFLRDALSEEALQTMHWVAELVRDKALLRGFGFQLRDEQLQASAPQPVAIPVVANLPRGSLVTWLSGAARFLEQEGEVLGMVIDDVHSVRHELRPERFAKATEFPEVVVSPQLPSLRFWGGFQAATLDVAGWGLDLELGDSQAEESPEPAASEA